MRICVKITGRWIRAKHFLNDKEIDRIMLIVLNSNQFSVHEDGKLKQEYKIDEVADQMIFEDDIEYSWMEKRGKAVPLSDFTVEYESGEGGTMSYEFDSPSEFDISKLKFGVMLCNCSCVKPNFDICKLVYIAVIAFTTPSGTSSAINKFSTIYCKLI